MADVTVIILTFNEQLHIKRCIDSVKPFAQQVILVDSFSTDDTQAIAMEAGCQEVQHAFTNHAEQFNWALDHLPLDTEWVMRLDADEYVLPELAEEINGRLDGLPADVSGINLKRQIGRAH
ncbi:MAG: glycosyltransferase family 2 protein, partial [Tepidisphaeraceae bacterium]